MDLKKLKSGASATPPVDTEAVSDGYPTAGSAVDDIAASKPGPYFFYQLQQELHAILTDGGVVPNKSTLTQLRDAIRAIANAKAGSLVQTSTSTGSQNDFAATTANRLILRANNASTLTLTGIVAGSDGDVIELISVGAGEVDIAHQDAGSSAANRVITPTGATVKLTAAKGRAWLVYDGTTQRWRLTNADPASTQIVQEGVSFPATQVASTDANTLDDYEEGTWTPGLTGASGGSGQTYASQVGHYVKIGKWVLVYGGFVLTAKGTITGSAQITGLPFASSSSFAQGLVVNAWSNLATAIASAFIVIADGATTGLLNGAISAAVLATNSLTSGDLNNNSAFGFSGLYRVAA